VDLSRLDEADVEPTREGRYRVRLPAVEGDLHLIDVTPYDVQDGRVLGLVDVIPMNAMRQGTLMQAAREQASELYERNDERYLTDARRSIERHLKALLRLFDVEIEIRWPDGASREVERETGGSPVLAGVAG
jgi:hypothetical protein